jgi:hypothetical protein
LHGIVTICYLKSVIKVINERVEAKATWYNDAIGGDDHRDDGIGYVN